VRDYVHVSDLADSHVAAARALEAGARLERVYNLGSGEGTSVRTMMDAVIAATGTALTPVISPRREGDPARIVASGALAARARNWARRHTVTDMVRSAWDAAPRWLATTPGCRPPALRSTRYSASEYARKSRGRRRRGRTSDDIPL